ncbi:ATP-binding protein [Streptomyces sp. NBC_01304]|uniref:ATP-binding protein n=1 Tax=Streptomyces sp. NBC_01304 TaxID=2903818 RepID=UPI002E145F25|nr:LuxR C-terminal-related transcriptional regulator [Streptomyces sp. NBC_01304]
MGRAAELAGVAAELRIARMVTVTGPGGVGKTRIALRTAARVAERYEHGVRLVELSELRDPELLPHTVAAALGLPENEARSPLDAVLDHLRDQRTLIVFDTCEHLVDACAMLADIMLRETTGVSVLATSRQPLDVPGEHICPVAPLPVQSDEGGDAIELFAQRAAAVVPGFTVDQANRADVVRLCRRLDGMPLAIELATVRLRAVPLGQLLERIEDRFRLLTGGRRTALPRHQTLRTAIEWSHDLCTAQEQLLWSRLSVFAGSFDIAAAEEVCAGGELPHEDVLQSLVGLVDKSVVLRVGEDGSRYRMLDTLREYGAEHLAVRGEEGAVRERHFAWCLVAAEGFDRHFLDDDQIARYRELRRRHTDLRVAVEYALATPGKDREAAALTGALWGYWHIAGLHTEGRYWYRKITDRFPDGRERAWALAQSSYLGAFQADPVALEQAQECVSLADGLGDPVIAGRGRVYLNLCHTFMGHHEEAAKAASEAYEILEAADDTIGLVTLETQIGLMNHLMGELDAAIAVCERGLRRFRADSTEGWVRGYLHYVTGATRYRRGEFGQSAESGRTALRIKHELGDGVGMGYCLELLAWLASHEERHEDAMRLIGAADPLWQNAGARLGGTAIMLDLHRTAVAAAERALGQARCGRLRAEGAAQALDQVVAVVTGEQEAAPVRGDVPAPRTARALRDAAAAAVALTRREREVALLAAESLSNREIAERLVISKRTVDAHLERILAKLGIASRGEIAGRLRG